METVAFGVGRQLPHICNDCRKGRMFCYSCQRERPEGERWSMAVHDLEAEAPEALPTLRVVVDLAALLAKTDAHSVEVARWFCPECLQRPVVR
jgi:hypothetical protein